MKQRSREKVKKYIYRSLLSLKNGDKLPSIRSIMKDCSASQRIVQSVLKNYEEEGCIKSKYRSGYCKVEAVNNSDNFDELDIIYCTRVLADDPILNFHAEFSHHLLKLCGERWHSVRTHYLEDAASTDAVKRIAKSTKCRACIVISSFGPELGEILNDHQIAYVNLLPEAYRLDEKTTNIVVDNEAVISNQINFLLNLGHKKIGYIDSLKKDEVQRSLTLRREIFLRMVLDLELPMKSHWMQYGGFHSDTTFAAVERMFSEDNSPTAIIVSDFHLPGVYAALSDMGLKPGKDVSVMGTNNLSITRMLSPMTTSLQISKKEAVEKTLDALEKVYRGEEAPSIIKIPSEIIERDSCCRL